MKTITLKKPFPMLPYKFNKFDGAYAYVDEDGGFEGPLNDFLSFSWDGAIYWMPKPLGDQFLPFLDKWFKENTKDMVFECGDECVSNCFLYKHTKNGLAIVDTCVDADSIGEKLFADFKAYTDHENGAITELSDCHLVDNLNLNRDMNDNTPESLLFFYEEGLLNDGILMYDLQYYTEKFNLDKTKPIVITGTFSVNRDELAETMRKNGFTIADKVTSDCVLWCGEKPGATKLKAAEKAGVEIITPADLIRRYIDNQDNDSRPSW